MSLQEAQAKARALVGKNTNEANNWLDISKRDNQRQHDEPWNKLFRNLPIGKVGARHLNRPPAKRWWQPRG